MGYCQNTRCNCCKLIKDGEACPECGLVYVGRVQDQLENKLCDICGKDLPDPLFTAGFALINIKEEGRYRSPYTQWRKTTYCEIKRVSASLCGPCLQGELSGQPKVWPKPPKTFFESLRTTYTQPSISSVLALIAKNKLSKVFPEVSKIKIPAKAHASTTFSSSWCPWVMMMTIEDWEHLKEELGRKLQSSFH